MFKLQQTGYLKSDWQLMTLTHVTLRQDKGHQMWHELVDPKQGYNRANCQRPRLNSLYQNANIKRVFQIRKHVKYLP